MQNVKEKLIAAPIKAFLNRMLLEKGRGPVKKLQVGHLQALPSPLHIAMWDTLNNRWIVSRTLMRAHVWNTDGGPMNERGVKIKIKMTRTELRVFKLLLKMKYTGRSL